MVGSESEERRARAGHRRMDAGREANRQFAVAVGESHGSTCGLVSERGRPEQWQLRERQLYAGAEVRLEAEHLIDAPRTRCAHPCDGILIQQPVTVHVADRGCQQPGKIAGSGDTAGRRPACARGLRSVEHIEPVEQRTGRPLGNDTAADPLLSPRGDPGGKVLDRMQACAFGLGHPDPQIEAQRRRHLPRHVLADGLAQHACERAVDERAEGERVVTVSGVRLPVGVLAFDCGLLAILEQRLERHDLIDGCEARSVGEHHPEGDRCRGRPPEGGPVVAERSIEVD